MNLNPIRANMIEVDTGNMIVLFSYKKAVAVQLKESGESYKTEKYWSRTTSRHINQWFNDPNDKILTKPQEYFDNLMKEVK